MSDLEQQPPAELRQPANALPPVPSAPPRRAHPIFWLMIGLGVVLFTVMTVLTTAFAFFSEGRGDSAETTWLPRSKVAVIPLEGELFESSATIQQLEHYAKSRSVKAIVVRINSPGGAIVPAQEISSEIRRIRLETGKPVVASVQGVAASGAYYVAVACDRIIANPGSLTGSIGVILQWMNVEDLVKWAKIRPETLTSGSLKDTGTPFREMTAGERAYLQSIVSQMHSQFVRAVIEGRKGKLSPAQVASLADGRVFTGEQARELRLIDELGDLHHAVDVAAELAGITGEPQTIYPRREERGILDVLVGSSRVNQIMNQVLNRKPQILYRW